MYTGKHVSSVMPCVIVLSLLLSACGTTKITSGGTSLPAGFEFNLPDGVEVVSIDLNGGKDVDLGGGRVGLSVAFTLNKPLPAGEIFIIPYAVRIVTLIHGTPLCVGFVGMTNADGTSATRNNSFELVCDDGNVAGRATSSAFGMADFDRSSGKRSIGIYVQHLEGFKTFLGDTVGITGVKSNHITASCKQ